jgi:hypothetical protein
MAQEFLTPEEQHQSRLDLETVRCGFWWGAPGLGKYEVSILTGMRFITTRKVLFGELSVETVNKLNTEKSCTSLSRTLVPLSNSLDMLTQLRSRLGTK